MPPVQEVRRGRPMGPLIALTLAIGSISIFLWSAPAEAQDERRFVDGSLGSSFLLRTWSEASGMPHGTVTAVAQSADGYVWLATFDGLARFNGWQFRTFGMSDGLASNRISSLMIDSRDDLWVGHEIEGLSRRRGEDFTVYSVADGLPAGTIWAMLEDVQNGVIYFGSDQGLFSLRPDEPEGGFRLEGSFEGTVHGLMIASDGALWAAGHHGLARRRPGQQQFEPISAPAGFIFSLYEDQHGSLWVGNGFGLWRGRSRGQSSSEDGSVAAEFDWQAVLQEDCPIENAASMSAIKVDRAGALWFRPCTNAMLASDTHIFRVPPEELERPQPAVERLIISGIPVTSGMWPAEIGGLWLGTYGRGVGALLPRRIQRWKMPERFGAQEIRAVVGDGDGGLWISANCAAPLVHFKDGHFSAVPLGTGSERERCIGGLARDDAGNLWLGHGGDLVLVRGRGEVYRRKLNKDKVRGLEIFSVLRDRQGRLWAGPAGEGLARLEGDGEQDFDFRDDRLTYFTRRDGLASDHVHSLTEDRQGDLWIGTNQGLSRHRDDQIRSYREVDGVPSGMVRAIHEDEQGRLWIGTYGGGLARADLSSGEPHFTRYNTESGLYDDVVTQLLEDREGRFWMLGNRGLFYHPRSQLEAFASGEIDRLTSVYFDEDDGMIEGSGGRQPSGWQMPDGRLFFPTVDGLVMIDSQRDELGAKPPAVRFEHVMIEQRRVAASSLGQQPMLELAPDERDFEIHYMVPGSLDAEKMRFRFRLEGYDEAWSEVGDRRVAYYTGLPPGDYVFRVAASDRYGRWSDQTASLNLMIHAPWWRTTVAYAGYVLLASLLIVAYVSRQQRRIQRGEELLEERTRQLQELAGMLPICASCKMVRDEEGLWEQMEVFFTNHSNLRFSHGLCPDCAREALKEVEET